MTSGNRHYVNGANFERRAKAILEEDGWFVFRTAGSHSPADLVAIKDWPSPVKRHPPESWVRLYQCKGGVTKMGPKARREFAEFAATLGAEPWLVERGMKFTHLVEDAA